LCQLLFPIPHPTSMSEDTTAELMSFVMEFGKKDFSIVTQNCNAVMIGVCSKHSKAMWRRWRRSFP